MARSNKPAPPDPRANVPAEYKPAEWLIKAPHRPANSKTAISHRDVLYSAIGRVLTQWELLETVLASEFQSLIGTTRNSALRAYGSVLASGTRCDMLLSAAEIELPGDELIGDIRRAAAARNLLAHGVVVSLANGKSTSDDPRLPVEGPFQIMAAPYNKSKFSLAKGGSAYAYSVEQVEAIGTEIQKLTTRVGARDPRVGFQRHWRFQI
jgi:hypothetical protein